MWGSDEEVISFIRKVINQILSSSSSDNEDIYESEDLEKMLQESAIEEKEELTNIGKLIHWSLITG